MSDMEPASTSRSEVMPAVVVEIDHRRKILTLIAVLLGMLPAAGTP